MFSVLPTRIRDYAVLQMAVSNGSSVSWTVEPEDCTFEKSEGQKIQALPAKTVVNTLFEKAGRGDVIKLIAAYEASLFNNAQIHSTNGYEARRQNAFADIGSSKLKAAAAASAIALVTTKLCARTIHRWRGVLSQPGEAARERKTDRQYGGGDVRFPAGRCPGERESALRAPTLERPLAHCVTQPAREAGVPYRARRTVCARRPEQRLCRARERTPHSRFLRRRLGRRPI